MTKTINGLTTTTSAASGDFIPIWRASNGDSRKITKANLLGGVLTGGGTIATGGFTLTVPATGQAALINVAQTFSVRPEFGAGLRLGSGNVLAHIPITSWTPTITASSGSNGTILTGNTCRYQQWGQIVVVSASITDIDTTGMTAGATFRIGNLPVAAAVISGAAWRGSVQFSNVSFGDYAVAVIPSGASYVQFAKMTSGSGVADLLVSDVTDNTADVHFNIVYMNEGT